MFSLQSHSILYDSHTVMMISGLMDWKLVGASCILGQTEITLQHSV